MILFCLIVNKQGRVRLRRNYQHIEEKEREVRDSLIISKCLTRTKKQCSFFTCDGLTIVYKSFTTLTLICGVTKEENELSIQELLNVFMDCLGSYFQHVLCFSSHRRLHEYQAQMIAEDGDCYIHMVVYNIERVYMILDELIVNGYVAYTSKERALIPLQLMDAGT